jgi:hypothetical protein
MNVRTLILGAALSALLFSTACPGGGDGKKKDKKDATEQGKDAGSEAKGGCEVHDDCTPSDVPCMVTECLGGDCVLMMEDDGESCEGDPCLVNQTCTGGVCETGGDPAPPACAPGTCDPDACGNECTCDAGLSCVAGICQASSCGDITFGGCCMPGEGVAKWCENDAVQEFDCAAQGGVCTWRPNDGFHGCGPPPDVLLSGDPEFPYLCPGEACDGSCEGKACGTDGCGVTCGVCAEGEACQEGACLVCSCDDVECGTDLCGNDCGGCDNGLCVANVCENDPCDFTGIEGCCKDAVLNYCSNEQGSIVDCADGGCGWDPAGNQGAGWYDCGFEEADPTGLFPQACFDPKDPPACVAVADCPPSPVICSEYSCVDGFCQLGLSSESTGCDDDSCFENQTCKAGECQGGQILPSDCTGLVCGPDACGHPCGDCLESMVCEKGACVPDLPVTYTLKIQPILQEHCSPCHTEQKLGGHNIGASYPDATKDATHPDCPGMSVGQCAVVRIVGLGMPKDAPGTVPAEEINLLKEWVDEGMKL